MSAELPKMPEPFAWASSLSIERIKVMSGAWAKIVLRILPESGDVALYTAADLELAKQEATRQAMERRWISVEERLPPPFEDVLIYPRPTDYCCEGQADMKGQWTYSDYEPYNGDVKHRINPTHWMPLPPPPAQLARAADAGGKEG